MEDILRDLSTTLSGYYEAGINFAPKFIIALFLLAGFWIIGGMVRNQLGSTLRRKMDDPLLADFLADILKITVYIIGSLLALQVLGLGGIAAGIVTGASVSAIVVGFAFKDIGENILAGIMLAFDRPFRVGDVVELEGLTGRIVGLNMRTTHFKSFDGKDIYMPNAVVVKNPVINFTMDGFLRYDFNVGIEYGEDVSKAINIIKKILLANDDIIQSGKKPDVSIGELSDSYLNLSVKYWINTLEAKAPASDIRTDLIDKVIDSLDKADYYLPGTVIEIKNYKDNTIPPTSKKATTPVDTNTESA